MPNNNSPHANPGDVGSPWAIGAKQGGHTVVHPALGTLQDYDALRKEAAALGIEIAMDLALQCMGFQSLEIRKFRSSEF